MSYGGLANDHILQMDITLHVHVTFALKGRSPILDNKLFLSHGKRLHVPLRKSISGVFSLQKANICKFSYIF